MGDRRGCCSGKCWYWFVLESDLDDFNGYVIDDEWDVISGDWSVTDPKLITSSNNALMVGNTTQNANGKAVVVYASIYLSEPGAEAKIIVNYVDSNNYDYVMVTAATSIGDQHDPDCWSTVDIYTRQEGVDTRVAGPVWLRLNWVSANQTWWFYVCRFRDQISWHSQDGRWGDSNDCTMATYQSSTNPPFGGDRATVADIASTTVGVGTGDLQGGQFGLTNFAVGRHHIQNGQAEEDGDPLGRLPDQPEGQCSSWETPPGCIDCGHCGGCAQYPDDDVNTLPPEELAVPVSGVYGCDLEGSATPCPDANQLNGLFILEPWYPRFAHQCVWGIAFDPPICGVYGLRAITCHAACTVRRVRFAWMHQAYNPTEIIDPQYDSPMKTGALESMDCEDWPEEYQSGEEVDCYGYIISGTLYGVHLSYDVTIDIGLVEA